MPAQRDLSGIVQPGRGLGAGLMADRVVMETLQERSGFPVVPGTLNVRLPGPLERGPSWRYMPAAEIAPDWEGRTGQAGYFLASVAVEGRYRGLAFRPSSRESAGIRPTRSSCSAKRICARNSPSTTATSLRSG